MGQKNFAVLTGDRINEVFFFLRKCMAVLPGGQIRVAAGLWAPGGRNNEVTVRWGFTVFANHRQSPEELVGVRV